jgi:hypothetical protein|tara:strand:- start:1352 stop:2098 length:747 start_codon:yes stop_codon:yes gene_type:complete
MITACRNVNHPVSVAEVIMTILKGKKELDQFTLTRGEYANKIDKSPNAVRMMMRHGKLSGEYRFDGSKYLFKSPERPRESYDNDHLNSFKLTTQTAQPKKVNRGNHFKADYPNDAFRLYNERKKEQAILNKIQGKFKNKEHELEYNKLNNAALKTALKNTEKDQSKQFTPLKNYGGPVAMRRVSYPSIDDDYNSRSPARKPFRGYDSIGSDYDDGSVSIDLSRSRPDDREPQFKDKIQESIWRLKNNK